MKIAQLYHDFSQRGGAERHVETLSDSLRELGHEITVVSRTPPDGFRGQALNFARLAAPVSALRLANWLRREGIQLVHAHSRISAAVASLALRMYRIPMVVTSHILPAGFTLASQWGDQTICVSEAVRRRLAESYRVPESKLTVIHNGIEACNDSVAAPLHLGPPPVFAFVARFAPGKGHEMFLRTAVRMLEDGFPGTFVLAGDGPLEADLRARYASSRIRFLGYRSDVPAILANSAASVMCSVSEAFPYVALESLAVGTPVVSTDCGGPSELVRDGENGFLFPLSDPQSLPRLLATVASGQSGLAPRERIAEDCRRTFSRGQMVGATLDVYRGVCLEGGWS
jgi:glycosyltransferase involved in cell wall biosynthesis